MIELEGLHAYRGPRDADGKFISGTVVDHGIVRGGVLVWLDKVTVVDDLTGGE